jgi:3-keto-disaccharide hydrolase
MIHRFRTGGLTLVFGLVLSLAAGSDRGGTGLAPAKTDPAPNTLTDAERAQGWRLLWDGHTSRGWRSAKGPGFPKQGWEMKEGILSVVETGGAESQAGGDIVTEETFAAFDLRVDFRLTPGANSGIKYYVDTELNKAEGSAIGLEYQLLDDARHPDAKEGRNGNRTLASLYDLIPAAAGKKPNRIGEWNEARIVSTGRQVEHWLNGEKVLEYERGSEEFRRLVAASKYKVWPGFGERPSGNILLQDHGNRVDFRNVKIRVLKRDSSS